MHEVASDYTLALTVSTSVPDPPRLKFASAQWPAIAAALLRDGPVGPADVGEEVVTHRSSWVRRRPTEGGDVYIKTYCYNTWGARLRNMAKHTAPCRRSRAAAEAAALLWLAEHGFPTAEPLAVLERRRLGFVVEAVLVTRAQPGTRAEQQHGAVAADREVQAPRPFAEQRGEGGTQFGRRHRRSALTVSRATRRQPSKRSSFCGP